MHDPVADPERLLIAIQELDAIEQLFADDPIVLRIIDGLGAGLTAEQIGATLGLSKTRLRLCAQAHASLPAAARD